jgi:large subunit ribosomal protein L3
MLNVLLGRKMGMTQVYDEDGVIRPVTVIELGPCTVLQVKTVENDGYTALQLGFADKRRKSASKAERGRAEKAGTEPKRFVREVRVDEIHADHKPGLVVTAAEFDGAKVVDVQGTTKGRGFQGVMTRHNFHGHPGSHGTSKVHRRPGSIATHRIGAIPKGQRMPGQMGNANLTIKNLSVVQLQPEKNLLLVNGAVPGPIGGFLSVKVAKRETKQ